MVKVKKYGLMELVMKENIRMERKRERDNMYGEMEQLIMEIS